MQLLKRFFLASAITSVLLCGVDAEAHIQKVELKNEHIKTELTPDIGGRLLAISLVGKPNFLRLGEAVTSTPNPVVSPESENIGYLGHEMWVGPQSEWWMHQTLNLTRAAEKATWPPDPYLILAKNTIIESSPERLIIQSPSSPISGVSLIKNYSLLKHQQNSLQLSVKATNMRTENIAWDIWFNTRTYSNTQVYVPVASLADVRVKNLEDKTFGPLAYSLANNIFSLDILPPPEGKMGRKGKLMIQPAQGWLAGFNKDQVLIIQFKHQQQAVIHPEQGQIELYSEYLPDRLEEGLLEMEVHAPYKQLAPSESMQAEEIWTLLEYKGIATRAAHIAFLHRHAQELGLTF